jgi:hypothetical protein
MDDFTRSTIFFVQEHQRWTVPIVFLLAFCESFAFTLSDSGIYFYPLTRRRVQAVRSSRVMLPSTPYLAATIA